MDRWSLTEVLLKGGPGTDSLAIGIWEDHPALVQRWNGTNDQIHGFPVSNHTAVWFVVPDWARGALLGAAPISPEARARAWSHLRLPGAPPAVDAGAAA